MAKLALYDSNHNKMVFNMINGDISKIIDAYNARSSLGNNGWAENNPPTLQVGSRFKDYIASYADVMHNYAPFQGITPATLVRDGFMVSNLISKGWLTVGIQKNFYLDNDLNNFISVLVENPSSDFNTTVYGHVVLTVTINGITTTLFNDLSATYDMGLTNSIYDGVSGMYPVILYGIHAGNDVVNTRYNVNKNIAEDIKDEAGNLEIPNTISPDNEPIGGWDGDFNPEGDTIDMPDEPDETISGTLAHGFLNIYAPSASQLQSFGALLWTNAFNVKWYDLDSISNLVLNAVSDPINYIVGLFMIPVTPTTTGSSGIYLGGVNANTVTAPRVSKQFKTIDFGTIEISELYGNYLDYSNSRVAIYLPYIGTADIDIQEIAGGSVTLRYIIDCFTGACVANVKCVKYTETPWGKVYKNETVHSYSGNVSIQLPISAGSFDTMMQGLVNIGLGLGTNTPAFVAQGMTQGVQGFSGDVTTRGSLSSNTGKLCYQTPYLMFTRPIESLPAKNNSLHGYGAGVGGKLSRFKGYVEISDVKLDGVNATDNELSMIESLLKGGVYV